MDSTQQDERNQEVVSFEQHGDERSENGEDMQTHGGSMTVPKEANINDDENNIHETNNEVMLKRQSFNDADEDLSLPKDPNEDIEEEDNQIQFNGLSKTVLQETHDLKAEDQKSPVEVDESIRYDESQAESNITVNGSIVTDFNGLTSLKLNVLGNDKQELEDDGGKRQSLDKPIYAPETTADESIISQDGQSQPDNQSQAGLEQEEEESEYESDSSESSDDEGEDPPLLHYTRLSQLPKPFFNKELITATLIHETFYAFGTSSGILYITDPNFIHLGTIRARKSPILSINTDGSHIIAASMDGTVAVALLSSINNATNTTAYDLKIPLYSVVFKGQYKESKSFIYSTKSGSIVISTLNWLGNRQERTLWKSPSDSSVVRLEIVKNVLVWLGDDGIGFMDLRTERVLKTIKRPKGSPKAELIWPKLNFIEHDRIIIGWVNYIWSIKIEESVTHNHHENSGHLQDNQSQNGSGFKFSSAMSSFSRSSQDVNITVEYHFKIEDDALIGGIGSFKDDGILILVLQEEQGKIIEAPELRVINYFNKEEVSSDEIVLRDYQHLKCNDFSLGQSNHSRVFLIASSDGIIANEYSLRDRFDWYVNNGKLLQAYDISQYLVSKRERASLGIRQVEAYIDENTAHNWENATKFLAKVIEDSFDLESKSNDVCVDLWDQWSWIYIKNRKFIQLAEILPRDKVRNVVNKSVYDRILDEFIETKDQLNFHKFLQYWDLSFFNSYDILKRLEILLEVEPDLDIFERCLAEFYLKLGQPRDAIRHLILLKDPIVLELLSKYHLISFFASDIPTIVKFQISDEELGTLPITDISDRVQGIIELLVTNRHELAPQTVIDITSSSKLEQITFLYLRALLQIDPLLTQPFETLIFHLYSKHNPTSLLPFLKKHHHYNINEAINTLQTTGQYKELVYLLSQVGQNREAMSLLINEMNDPVQALDFARDQNSKELWDIFIEHGITKPNFIKVIIQYTGVIFDTTILKRIPTGVEIDGLQTSLIRIMTDNYCDLTTQETILRILEIEGVTYCDLMNELKMKGRFVGNGKDLEVFRHYEGVKINEKGEVQGIGNYF